MRNELDTLRREAESALRAEIALSHYNELLINKSYVVKANENVYFWKLIESALTIKVMIGVRRLYESKSDSFNFQNFINNCKINIHEFSLMALEKRKIDGRTCRPVWLDDYLSKAYVPIESDFDQLSKLVRTNSKQMKGIYTTAASKIFAHAIHTDPDQVDELLSDINLGEIESALTSIWHVYTQVWGMLENGRRPIFEVQPYPYTDEVRESIRAQLISTPRVPARD